MPRIDKQFFVLFLFIFLVFLAASIYYYHNAIQEDGSISWLDFRVYYYAGFGLEAGSDIYSIEHGYFSYKYAPVFAVIMSVMRFSNTTMVDALRVWYLILFGSFVVSVYLVKEILFYKPREAMRFFDITPLLFVFRYLFLTNFILPYTPRDWPLFIRVYDVILLYALFPLYMVNLLFMRKAENGEKRLLIMALSVLFILRFAILNIDRAQINIVILLFVLFFVYSVIKKRDIAAGIYLGVAVVIKLTPAIFVLYLLAKKKFKAFFSSLATFGALLFIPSFKVGFERNSGLVIGWINALKETVPSEYLQHKNQSLMAAISRFFSENSDVALIGLRDHYLWSLIAIVYAVFLSALVFAVIKNGNVPANERLICDFSLFFAAMTLLSPVGTKTTFVYLLLPIAFLIREAFRRKLKDKFLNIGLLAYVSLVYLNSGDIVGGFSIVLHKYSFMTFCIAIIIALLVYVKKLGNIFDKAPLY